MAHPHAPAHLTSPTLRTCAAAAVLALVVSLLLTVPADAASTAGAVDDAQDASGTTSYQVDRCDEDPVGDAAVPGGDLVDTCTIYRESAGSLVFSAARAVRTSPLTDDAWLNPATGLDIAVSTEGDAAPELTFTLRRAGDTMATDAIDGDGTPGACATNFRIVGASLVILADPACIPESPAIGVTFTLTYQPAPDTAVSVDRTPDDAATPPIPRDDPPPPVCANEQTQTGTQLTIRRLACGIGGTEPISQAVAMSQFTQDDPDTLAIDPYTADWVVIARGDDFADALTGSSLSFGQGPLLFTYSPGNAPVGEDSSVLAAITTQELLRVLPRGRTVYLMGGAAALDPNIDVQLTDLGYDVVRFAGSGREETAQLVAREVDRRVAEFTADGRFPDTNMVLIATRSNWPDAVVAGSVGAFWGMPILLVNAQPPVHPATLAALDELRPDYIHVIGGDAVISNAAGGELANHARNNGYALGRPGEDLTTQPWNSFCGGSFVCRWGGLNRVQTGGAIGQLNRDMVGRFAPVTDLVPDNPQEYAVAVELGATGPNFAYALAASTVSGVFGGAVFVATEGSRLTDDIVNALCNTPGSEGFIEQVENLVLTTDTDILTDAFADEVRSLVEDGCPATFAGPRGPRPTGPTGL